MAGTHKVTGVSSNGGAGLDSEDKQNLDLIEQNTGEVKKPVATITRTTNLDSSESWTSDWIETSHAQGGFRLRSDSDINVSFDFSIDGIDSDSTNLPPYKYVSGTIQPPHKVEVIARYYRVTLQNVGPSTSTVMRFQFLEGEYGALTSPVNSIIGQNADAQIVRMTPSELEIASGKFDGYSLVPKFGKNSDIDSGSLPEDVIEVGGQYTGFVDPSTPQRFYVVSSDASDMGTLTFSYLASETATSYSTATVTLNGLIPVDTGIDGIFAHTMRYNTVTGTGFNAGTITLRNLAATATFLTIIPNRSQSNYAVFMIPAGSTGYIQRIHGAIRGGNSTTVDGALWVKEADRSPRLRRPFSIGLNARLNDPIYGGLRVTEGTQIALRITATTGNNIDIGAGFDIVLVKNV